MVKTEIDDKAGVLASDAAFSTPRTPTKPYGGTNSQVPGQKWKAEETDEEEPAGDDDSDDDGAGSPSDLDDDSDYAPGPPATPRQANATPGPSTPTPVTPSKRKAPRTPNTSPRKRQRVNEDRPVPDPPTGWSMEEWKAFLFDTHCTNCQKKNPTTHFFTILQRLCATCRKNGGLEKGAANKVYGSQLSASTLSKLPTYVMGYLKKGTREKLGYWKDDISRLMQRQIESQSQPRVKGTPTFLQRLKQERDEREVFAARCDAWTKASVNQQKSDLTTILISVRSKLIAAGHNQADVNIVTQDDRYIKKVAELGGLDDELWEQYLPKWEDAVNKAKEDRLQEGREEQVVLAYQVWLKALTNEKEPEVHKLIEYPAAWEIVKTPQIAALVRSARAIDAQIVKKLYTFFPQLVKHLLRVKEMRLEAEMCKHLEQVFFGRGGTIDLSDTNPWELATMVFTCKDTSHDHRHDKNLVPLIGFPMISIHQSMEMRGAGPLCPEASVVNHIYFDTIGSRLAKSLIELAGLNASTAKISEMDQLQTRYICRACMQGEPYYGGKDSLPILRQSVDRATFSWRHAIGHALLHHPQLVEEDRVSFQVCNGHHDGWSSEDASAAEAEAWMCGWCMNQEISNKATIMSHVQTQHPKAANNEGYDYFVSQEHRLRYLYGHYARSASELKRYHLFGPGFSTWSKNTDYPELMKKMGKHVHVRAPPSQFTRVIPPNPPEAADVDEDLSFDFN